MPRPPYAAALLLALGVVLAPLGAPAPAAAEPGQPPSATATADPAAPGPGAESPQEQAEVALERVEEALGEEGAEEPGEPAPAPLTPAESRRLTLDLRDLALLRGELDERQDRRAAREYLARPTDGAGASYGAEYSVDEAPPRCGDDVCVHRVASTEDRATRAYADQVLAALESAHDTYVRAGYRAPLPDRDAADNGGDGRTDVYLADIGERRVFGFCSSDQPRRTGSYAAWVYCVLDNDYDPDQYPRQTPRENLLVTAAHEYFHAVQYGYDFTEDAWLSEGTAAWVEDEVHDDIDDNVGYLAKSPLRQADRPLDRDDGGLEVYGAWSWFRYLSERFPAEQGGLPTIVRRTWELADSVGAARDLYSLRAVDAALAERGADVGPVFADFAAANRFPAQRYEEGLANAYPRARLAATRGLSRGDRSTSLKRRVDHLAAATVRLEPGAGLRGRRWTVRLDVDLPKRKHGSQVRVSSVDGDGVATTTTVALDRRGDARVSRSFSSRQVSAVEVHLVNASTRIVDCYSFGSISCQGFARDDLKRVRLSAQVRKQ